MKLNRFIPLCLVAMLLLTAAGACKRHAGNHISVKLLALAEKINAAPDTVLANGMTLTGCNINPKDSLFTYELTVPDTRFNSVSADSLKNVFGYELSVESKRNLLKALRENSLGLCYECTLPDTTISVVFSPAEIAAINLEKQ